MNDFNMAGVNNGVIPADVGVASDQAAASKHLSEQAASKGTGVEAAKPSGDTSAWATKHPDLASKGFKSQEDLEKAYLEVERSRSQGVNTIKEYEDFIKQVEPYIPDINRIIEEKANKEKQGGDKKDVDVAQLINKAVSEALGPVIKQNTASQESARKAASNRALTRFRKENPDIKDHEDAIHDMFKSGQISVVGDRLDEESYIKALSTGLTLAKANIAEKKAASAAAATAEAGSNGDSGGEGASRSHLTLEQSRKLLTDD